MYDLGKADIILKKWMWMKKIRTVQKIIMLCEKGQTDVMIADDTQQHQQSGWWIKIISYEQTDLLIMNDDDDMEEIHTYR